MRAWRKPKNMLILSKELLSIPMRMVVYYNAQFAINSSLRTLNTAGNAINVLKGSTIIENGSILVLAGKITCILFYSFWPISS